MQLPGKKRRGTPKRRYMKGLNEDMKVAGVTVKDASDSSSWKKQYAVATPNRDKSKEVHSKFFAVVRHRKNASNLQSQICFQ